MVLLSMMSLARFAPAQQVERQRPAPRELSKDAEGLKAAFAEIIRPAAEGTLTVLCDDKAAALGTIVGADGWIITKASELSGKITCRLRNGRVFDAKLVGVVEDCDLAMLKGDVKDLPAVRFGKSKGAGVGQWVATAGAAALPVAVGMISVGPRRITGRNVMLGVTLEEASGGGAKVIQVFPNSGAEKAGIQVNDLITSLAGRATLSREDVTDMLQSFHLGDRVKVRVKRGDKELDVTAVLGQRPVTPPSRTDNMNSLGGPLSKRSTGFPLVIQHDTVLKPIECGGPLVNLDGQVIGINIARAGRTESYALPAETVVALLDDLKGGKFPATTQPTATQPSATQPTTRKAAEK
jgi:serine protease Do